MPAEIYGTLYNQNDLNVVITMVKDIYAKKPESANPTGATGGSSAPFILIKAPNGSSKRVHFQADESLSDRIDRLTDTLYRMDMDGKLVRKPYKPYITSPSAEDVEVSPDPEEVDREEIEVMVGPGVRVDSEEEKEDFPEEVDFRVKSLTKAQQPKDPECLGKW